MEKSVKITLIVCVTVLIIALSGFFAFNSLKPKATLDSQGMANVKAVPDKTVIYINIDTNATTAEAAKNKNDEIYNKLIVELKKIGIMKDELKTESYNIYQDYEWTSEGRKERGYRAVLNLKINVNSSESDKAGKIIDVTVSSGALISYINFELSQEMQNKYKKEALKLATEDAKVKAEAVASGLGKKIGKLVSVSMSSFDYYPWPVYVRAEGIATDTAEAKQSISVIPEERDVYANVMTTWELK